MGGREEETVAPLVSVVMPVYNGARFLREAVDSILNQTFQDFELIVVDDGSTDATPRILARCRDTRIRVIRQENAGQAVARNRAAREARGQYLAIHDADDVYLPERLETQIRFLSRHPDVQLLGTCAMMVDERGQAVQFLNVPEGHDEIRSLIMERDVFVHPTLLFSKSAFKACGEYRSPFVPAEDYDLVLRITERFRSANIRKPLVRYRVHTRNVSVRRMAVQVFLSGIARELAEERAREGRDRLERGQPLLTESDAKEMEAIRGNPRAQALGFLHWGRIFEEGNRRVMAAKLYARGLLIDPTDQEMRERLGRIVLGDHGLRLAVSAKRLLGR